MEQPKLERFRIVKPLGAGGMGMVYLAHDLLLDRNVALKQLDPEQLTSKMRQTRFFREARILSKLDHPHICRIYDLISSGGYDYLVLEYLQGQSLKEMDWDTVPLHQKWEILHQIAQALQCAHTQKIVHRDLKPENIMLTDQGIKVLDFGLSRSAEEQRALIESYSGDNSLKRKICNPEETEHGAFIGTLFYMSPEQARTEQATPQSDIYSFGVIAHELFTGQKPYPPGLNIENLIRTVAYGQVDLGDLPVGTRSLVQSMLAVNPHKRPNAQELVNWIDPQKKAYQRRRKKMVWGLIAALFAFLAWWHWLKPKPPEEDLLILWNAAAVRKTPGLEAQALLLEKFLIHSTDISPFLAPLKFQSLDDLNVLLEPNPYFEAAVLLDSFPAGDDHQIFSRTFKSGKYNSVAEIPLVSLDENEAHWKSVWRFADSSVFGAANQLHAFACVLLRRGEFNRAHLYFEGAGKLDPHWKANLLGLAVSEALQDDLDNLEAKFLEHFNGRSLDHYLVIDSLLRGLKEKDPALGLKITQMLPIGFCEKQHLKIRLCLVSSEILFKMGNHQNAVEKSSQALKCAQKLGHPFYLASAHQVLASQHRSLNLHGRADNHQFQANAFLEKLPEILRPIVSPAPQLLQAQ